jgi:hypothetical protein
VDVGARLEAVMAENAMLRERCALLEAALGADMPPPVELALTPQEGRLFGLLMKRELMTKEAAMAVLYRDVGRDEAEVKAARRLIEAAA